MTRKDTIMTMSRDDEHPFWYACVLMAFHIMVRFSPEGSSPSKKSMEVLWVHWLGVDRDHRWGFKEGHLPKVGFVPDKPDHIPFSDNRPYLHATNDDPPQIWHKLLGSYIQMVKELHDKWVDKEPKAIQEHNLVKTHLTMSKGIGLLT